MIDNVAKRQFVVSIFVLLQATKMLEWIRCNDLFSLTGQRSAPRISLKWSMIELALLAVLLVWRIPRLTFKARSAALLAVAIVAINALAFIAFPPMWLSLRARFIHLDSTASKFHGPLPKGAKYPSRRGVEIDNVAGSRASLLEQTQDSMHLSGSYTVKVRPWSMGELNAENAPICIPVSTPMPNGGGLSEAIRRPIRSTRPSPSASIPITMRGVPPWRVAISCNGAHYSDIVIGEPLTAAPRKSKASTSKADSASVQLEIVATTFLVDRIGTFAITSIVDGNEADGRIAGEPYVVAPCPEARLDGAIVKNGLDMCLGADFPITIWLAGGREEPYTLRFDIILDEAKRTEHIIVAEVHSLPPSGGSKAHPAGSFWRPYMFPLRAMPNQEQFLLRIASVVDAKGFVHTYDGSWDNGDGTIVNVLQPPRLSWQWAGRSSRMPKIYADPRDGGTGAVGSSLALPVAIKGTAPFTFTFENPDGTISTVKDFHESIVRLPALHPGTYRLKSIKDALCSGSVDANSEITVQTVYAPLASIVRGTPIRSSMCDRIIGLTFDFELHGEAPWSLTASVVRVGKLDAQGRRVSMENDASRRGGAKKGTLLLIRSDTNVLRYEWKPALPGTYEITFVSLSDANYDAVPLRETAPIAESEKDGNRSAITLHYTQDIMPSPEATFVETGMDRYACVGDTCDALNVSVRLYGVSPWKLEYAASLPNGKIQSYKMENIDRSNVDLDLDPFTKAGRYVISLLTVTDGTGCKTSAAAKQQSVAISIFAHTPSASFIVDTPSRGKGVPAIARLKEGVTDEAVPIHIDCNQLPARVSIKFTPSEPSNVEYRQGKEHGDATTEERLEFSLSSSSSPRLPLHRPGKYEIVSVGDAFCTGHVEEWRTRPSYPAGTDAIVVQVIPRPTASFVPSQKSDISNSPWCCHARERQSNLAIRVTGNGVISVHYTIQYAVDESGLKGAKTERRLTSGRGPLINLLNESTIRPPGFYLYRLVAISDKHFVEVPLPESLPSATPKEGAQIFSFTQQVLPDPSPRLAFVSQSSSTFCIDQAPLEQRQGGKGSIPSQIGAKASQDVADEPEAAKIHGVGPFLVDFVGSELATSMPIKVSFDVLSKSGIVILTDVQVLREAKAPILFTVARIHRAGQYNLRIKSVENALGCLWTAPKRQSLSSAIREQTAIAFDVVERPHIHFVASHSMDASDSGSKGGDDAYLCVGDVARFQLSGTGPWTVSYTLIDGDGHEKKRTDTLSTGHLNILLAEAGSLVVHSVCNRYCCSKTLKDSKALTIYPLPSASINSGTQYVREGEEAEFSVSLKGTPPFSYTYERIGDLDRRVLDRHTVDGVQRNEDKIKVAAGGTFRVVHVKSRHCEFPKKMPAIK